MSDSRRRLAAIMFTDMVGYSALAQADEATALRILEEHNRILRPIFSKFQGREVKTVGDAFLVEFESALDSARCAVEIQQALYDHNAALPDNRAIRVRIGLHVGDVVEATGDVLGDAVNIASRIEPLAEPGGVCLTQQVFDQIQNKFAFPLARLPPLALKNIRIPTTVYRVVEPWEPSSPPPLAHGTDGDRSRALAVLPLANISPDPKDEYFADGLTEELISVLSQVPGLSVIARTSVAPYKTSPKAIPQVAAELGVDTVLEGSVRKAGSRIRITLQLVDARSQRHIWASSYNREIDDVFTVQSDIANRTAEALRLELVPEERRPARTRPTSNLAAYETYLRGLVASRVPGGQGFDEAVRSFDEATQKDPNFAEAFAAWGNLYVLAAGSYRPLREVMPRARELAARALTLEPNSSDAHATMGNIALQFDHDWGRAEAEFDRAISLNPNNATALTFLTLLLISLERFDEARENVRRAVRLDPAGNHHREFAWIEMESGNFDAAIRLGEEERDRHPALFAAHFFLGMSYLAAGRRADALREADTPLIEADETDRFDHALLNAVLGRPDEGREILRVDERGESKEYNSGTDLAMLYAAVGEKEKALALLEKDSREGDQLLWLYYRAVFFDSIRDDPRFVALLRQFGLPTHGIRRRTTP